MLAALRYLDARLAEASTWSAITGVLAGLGVVLPSGLSQEISLFGMFAAGLFGVLLSETGTRPPTQVALDMLEQVVPLLQARAEIPQAVLASSPVAPVTVSGDALKGSAAVAAVLLAAGLVLSACSAAQQAQVAAAVQVAATDAQLFCAKATPTGTVVMAVVSALDPAARAIAVTTKDVVDSVCSSVDAFPVSPPPVGTVVPTVATTIAAPVVGATI